MAKIQDCVKILDECTPNGFGDGWMDRFNICSLYLSECISVDVREIASKKDNEVKRLIQRRIIDAYADAIARIEPCIEKEKGMIEPLKDNVLIKPIEDPTYKPGGIVLPDRAQNIPHFGRVAYVGPDVQNLKPHDLVLLPTWNDDELIIGNTKYIVLAEKSISVRISE